MSRTAVSLDHGEASGAPTLTRIHQARDPRRGEQSWGGALHGGREAAEGRSGGTGDGVDRMKGKKCS